MVVDFVFAATAAAAVCCLLFAKLSSIQKILRNSDVNDESFVLA